MILSISAVLIESTLQFIIARSILGITTGLNAMIVPLYIKEMSPDALSEKTPLNNLMPIYIKQRVPPSEISGKMVSFT